MKKLLITRSTLLSSLLMVSCVIGCAVGPEYKEPKTDLSPFHYGVAANANTNAKVQLDTWWSDFNDPELLKIVERALSQNLDLAASLARVSQARALANGSSAQLLPSLDFKGSVTREHESLAGPFGTVSKGASGFKRNTSDFAAGPAASWEIDLFGGLRRGATASEDEFQAASADHMGTRISVAADSADAYFQIRGYQSRIAIAEQQISDDEHLLQLVINQRDAGSASEREVAQAEALFKQARAALPPLRIGLEIQLNRLDVLMGAQPGTYEKELRAAAEIAVIPAIPTDVQPVNVLRRRPDVIAAERRLAASSERIGAAIADYYPKVSLSGAIGFDSLSASHFFDTSAFQTVGGGALRWRIFDFGKVNAEIAQARGANAEALAQYRKSVLRAVEDVEDSLVVLAQTKIHVTEIQDEVQALVKARDLSEQSYKAGSITLTDVLDADRQLLLARDEFNSIKVDTARAAVGVFRAFGGGWETPKDKKATLASNVVK